MVNFFSNDNSKKIYDEVWAYFNFQNEINKYFNEGVNLQKNNGEQEIYFVDYNWIKSWKKYTNYENVIGMGKDNYDFLKENGFLEYKEKPNFKYIGSGTSYKRFLSKTVYNKEDFDCIIDKKTYSYFKTYRDLYVPIIGEVFANIHINLEHINCIFFDNMLALLIPIDNRIKLIFKHEFHSSFELFQFNLLFQDNINKDDFPTFDLALNDFPTILTQNDASNYYLFKENELKDEKERLKLIDNLLNESEEGKKKFKKYNCEVTNLISFKTNLSNVKNDYLKFSLNNINHRLIGLQNIGATCYMNATLQCLVNLKQFTNYLLTKNNFFYILQNINTCEVIGIYCQLLQKLCCDEKIINYYAPEEFKNIISLKNPLFEGIKANDSKDLIYFLLEQMNYELNQAKLKINPNLQKKENEFITDQTNKSIELSNFIQE